MSANPFLNDTTDVVTANRLSRLQDSLRALNLSTREEYQAQVYNLVNAVLNIQGQMQELINIAGETPAVVGDVTGNFTILNRDASDLADDIADIENEAAALYNLTATSQNSLRQAIREGLYQSTKSRFIEPFINDGQLQSGYTVSLDYNAGLASLPLTSETQLTPTFSVGVNSVGSALTPIDNLTSTEIGTSFIWNGATLELVLTFPTAQILNRIQIQLDTYSGIQVTSFTTSPDGTLSQDVLNDLGVTQLTLDATSGKYSGDVIIDFPPRYVQQAKLTLVDRAGVAQIALRGLSAYSRQYQSSGVVTTNPIYLAAGTVNFSVSQLIPAPYTSISHQISYDGVNYTSIEPGPLTTATPFWYRSILQRSDSAFISKQSAVVQSPASTAVSQNYTLVSQSSVPLGNGVVEQTIVLANVTGSIQINDVPLPGTLRVQAGSIYLGAADYSFSNGTLSFPNSKPGITITYQTSALGSAAIAALKNYYTPLLQQVLFSL